MSDQSTEQDEEPDALSLEWKGNGHAVMLVIGFDGVATFSVREEGEFYSVMREFDFPLDLANAIKGCSADDI